MSIPIQCDSCGKKFKGKDVLAGKRVACPNCKQPINVPAQEASSLGDLLDEELAIAAEEPEQPAVANEPAGRTCYRCGDILLPDTHFCAVCGCNNRDIQDSQGVTALERGKQKQDLEEAEKPRHWFWGALWWWG